jgi:hypothetical protein
MKKEQKNNSGFKVPNGYFETFTDRLLETLGNEVTQLPGDDGFTVPKGYFADFNGRLRPQLETPGGKVRKLYPYRNYFVAASVAAVVLLLLAMPWNSREQISFDDLSGNDIEAYFQGGEIDLTNDEIAQLLPVGDLELNDMMESRLNDEHIMEYLDGSIDNYEDLNFESDE